MKTTHQLTALVACVLGAACGAPTDSTDAGLVDGGGGGVTVSPNKNGTIFLTQVESNVGDGGKAYTVSAGAVFIETKTVPPTDQPGCTTTQQAPCSIVRCAPFDAGVVDAGAVDSTPSIIFASAGDLTLSGFKGGSGTTMKPADPNFSYGKSDTVQWWTGVETITSTASGSIIPAFSQTLATPSLIKVSAPNCSGPSGCGTINRSNPLAVTWTGGASGNVTVLLSSAKDGKTSAITCTYAATAGTADLAAAILGNLEAGPGSLSVSSTNTKTFAAGEFSVKFSAVSSGLAGAATFQ